MTIKAILGTKKTPRVNKILVLRDGIIVHNSAELTAFSSVRQHLDQTVSRQTEKWLVRKSASISTWQTGSYGFSQGACSVVAFEMKTDKRQIVYMYSLTIYKRRLFPVPGISKVHSDGKIKVISVHLPLTNYSFFLSFYPHGKNTCCLQNVFKATTLSNWAERLSFFILQMTLFTPVYCTFLLKVQQKWLDSKVRAMFTVRHLVK